MFFPFLNNNYKIISIEYHFKYELYQVDSNSNILFKLLE